MTQIPEKTDTHVPWTDESVLPGWTDSPAPRAVRAPRRLWRPSWLLLGLLGVLVLVNLHHAFPQYFSLQSSSARIMLKPNLEWHYPLLLVHIFTGNIAMVTLFFQLWPWLRRNHPSIHRWNGRVYVFAGAIPAALAGLVLVPLRPDPAGSLGLATMSVLWLFTTAWGWRKARQRRYVEHRRWMLYSFALALGTTWGRVIFLGFTHIEGFTMNISLLIDIANWFCWVANLLVVQWWLERTAPRAAQIVRRG